MYDEYVCHQYIIDIDIVTDNIVYHHALQSILPLHGDLSPNPLDAESESYRFGASSRPILEPSRDPWKKHITKSHIACIDGEFH